ncbi:hypothetical protein ABI59_14060 [Acidobacteria bacterium Mor1]|nr:hypothetical protein ABI59_14060 [Acidobacteria bacterium Mor1]
MAMNRNRIGVLLLCLFAASTMALHAADRPQLCELLPVADVSAVTGGTYKTTEQQADYANIAHCGYLGAGGPDSVSITFAKGDTASQRWEQGNMFNPKAIEGFLDQAAWEPMRGTLTARSGDKFAEIRISKSDNHGDEATRIAKAKKLVEMLFEKL